MVLLCAAAAVAASPRWAWMGCNTDYQVSGPQPPGSYGTQGVPSRLNDPGPRLGMSIAEDQENGLLYLFGGVGRGATPTLGASS